MVHYHFNSNWSHTLNVLLQLNQGNFWYWYSIIKQPHESNRFHDSGCFINCIIKCEMECVETRDASICCQTETWATALQLVAAPVFTWLVFSQPGHTNNRFVLKGGKPCWSAFTSHISPKQHMSVCYRCRFSSVFIFLSLPYAVRPRPCYSSLL